MNIFNLQQERIWQQKNTIFSISQSSLKKWNTDHTDDTDLHGSLFNIKNPQRSLRFTLATFAVNIFKIFIQCESSFI